VTEISALVMCTTQKRQTALGLDAQQLVESQQCQNSQHLTSRPRKDDAPAIGLKGLVDTQQGLGPGRIQEREPTQIEMEFATLARGTGDGALEFPDARNVQFAPDVHDVSASVVLVAASQ
jgi:hypothetical protein